MKIKVSIGNIDEAIRQIEEYEKSLNEKCRKLVQRLVDEGVLVAKAKLISLGAFESGELVSSMQGFMYKEGNKGLIIADCKHAAFVEFGTGVVGSNKPHPDIPEDMPVTWIYDSNEHGEDGWYYYDEQQGRYRFTKGMPSRPFMYETAADLRDKLTEYAKEVFKSD